MIPPRRLTLVGPVGTVTDEWYKFFDRINRELGGDGCSTLISLRAGDLEVPDLSIEGEGPIKIEIFP